MAGTAAINVSVSSHYSEDSYGSETVTQGILGERVKIIEHHPLFSKIKQADGYISWISTDQLVLDAPPLDNAVQVRSHFIRIREQPAADAPAIRDAVIGTRLSGDDERNGWTRVILPDGTPGWTESDHFGAFLPATPTLIVERAREFIGYQYTWGGRSPKGFDCSGFIQTIFALHHVQLPRDSWQQQEKHEISRMFEDALPGDLLFFARTPERITHVAVSIGNMRFIHASGWVRYNSLNPSDPDFSASQLDTFVSVNRYPLPDEQP